jgi:hypothetical protein
MLPSNTKNGEKYIFKFPKFTPHIIRGPQTKWSFGNFSFGLTLGYIPHIVGIIRTFFIAWGGGFLSQTETEEKTKEFTSRRLTAYIVQSTNLQCTMQNVQCSMNNVQCSVQF